MSIIYFCLHKLTITSTKIIGGEKSVPLSNQVLNGCDREGNKKYLQPRYRCKKKIIYPVVFRSLYYILLYCLFYTISYYVYNLLCLRVKEDVHNMFLGISVNVMLLIFVLLLRIYDSLLRKTGNNMIMCILDLIKWH